MSSALATRPPARAGSVVTEGLAVRALLIGIAVVFLALFLVLPLVTVFIQAFAKGWSAYLAAFTEADARSATAQARFTGILVAAMPAGAALLAELLSPGFVSGMAGNGAAFALLAAAAGLQVAGFAAISRLGRISGAA